MTTIRKVLAAAALLPGMLGSAQAESFASAILDINNLRLLHSTGVAYNSTDFALLSGTNDASVSATFNGVTSTSTVSLPVLSGAVPDVSHQCSGLCVPRAENDFTPFPSPPPVPGDFGYGDQAMTGRVITVGSVAAGAHMRVRSDTSHTGAGSAVALASSSTTFSFTLLASDSITIAFDATPYTQASVSGASAPGTIADARLVWQFDLFRISTGTTEFSYAPADLNSLSHVNRSGTLPGTVTYNPGTSAHSATSPVLSPLVYDPRTRSFSLTTPFLQAGEAYGISIRQSALATVQQVPEPASLAIFGLGLMAMAALARRRPPASGARSVGKISSFGRAS